MNALAENPNRVIILPGDSQARIARGGIPIAIPNRLRWSPEGERFVRDLRAVRLAVERRRRRHGPRIPLCSTTFGGSTVPPLFVGGASLPLIRTTSVGATFNNNLQGVPHSMSLPASRAVGDKLFYASVGFNFGSGVPAEAGVTWSASPNFLTCGDTKARQLLSRNTTNDALDAITIPAGLNTTNLFVAFVWNVTSDIPGEPASTLSTYQGSSLNDTFSGATTTWDFFLNPTMTAGPNPQRYIGAHAQAIRGATVGSPIITGAIGDGDGNGCDIIRNVTVNSSAGTGIVTANQTIWWQEAERYDEIQASLAGGALAYGPATPSRCQYNQATGNQTS